MTDLAKVGKDNLLKIIDESVLGGVNLVQVREKTLHQDELESLVLDIIDVVNGRAHIAVNSSVEASHISGVDFLHLPESQLDLSTTNIDSNLYVDVALLLDHLCPRFGSDGDLGWSWAQYNQNRRRT